MNRDQANTESQGGQRPLKSENSLFIAFSYYNFKKSGGSADPSDPVLAGPLVKAD